MQNSMKHKPSKNALGATKSNLHNNNKKKADHHPTTPHNELQVDNYQLPQRIKNDDDHFINRRFRPALRAVAATPSGRRRAGRGGGVGAGDEGG